MIKYECMGKKIYTIEEIKEKAVPIAKSYGVNELSLFGSYSRNEQNENSDVDFFIKSGDLRGYFAYFNFVNELEKIFNCHVDVIMDGIEDKDFLDRIDKDKKVLYVK